MIRYILYRSLVFRFCLLRKNNLITYSFIFTGNLYYNETVEAFLMRHVSRYVDPTFFLNVFYMGFVNICSVGFSKLTCYSLRLPGLRDSLFDDASPSVGVLCSSSMPTSRFIFLLTDFSSLLYIEVLCGEISFVSKLLICIFPLRQSINSVQNDFIRCSHR